MIKRAVPAVLGFLGLCLPLAAQQTATDVETFTSDQLRRTGAVDIGPALTLARPDVFSMVDSSVLIHGLQVQPLIDGRPFLLSGRADPFGLLPVAFLSAVEVQKINSSPMYPTDAPGGVVDLHLRRDIYAGGEFGVFYGKSNSKYGSEIFQSYIIGGVGNDRFNITAGASYQESSGNIPRRAW